MKSGTWRIIVAGDQIAVQRSITLTVGIPQTSTVVVRTLGFKSLERARKRRRLLSRRLSYANSRTGNTNHRARNYQHAEG